MLQAPHAGPMPAQPGVRILSAGKQEAASTTLGWAGADRSGKLLRVGKAG